MWAESLYLSYFGSNYSTTDITFIVVRRVCVAKLWPLGVAPVTFSEQWLSVHVPSSVQLSRRAGLWSLPGADLCYTWRHLLMWCKTDSPSELCVDRLQSQLYHNCAPLRGHKHTLSQLWRCHCNQPVGDVQSRPPGMVLQVSWCKNTPHIFFPKSRSSAITKMRLAVRYHINSTCHLLIRPPSSRPSRSGVLRTQKLKPHLLRSQSSKVLPLKPGVGHDRAMHASPTAGNSSLN